MSINEMDSKIKELREDRRWVFADTMNKIAAIDGLVKNGGKKWIS